MRVTQGIARGAVVEGGYAFKNLPYAAPPVGANRWRDAQPTAAWRGVRDATTFGLACPQLPMGWNDGDAQRAREDCLSLNVWTPQLGDAGAAHGLPVMVWIHGGGFNGGSASNEFTDGAKLMRHGVVVVTLNYRLGVLGFLAHPDLTRERASHTSGNYGFTDQLAALRWVQANIARFGGDPANVTAFGQSAGGIALSWLMTSPQAHGLFHRVILESGSAFGAGRALFPRAQAEHVGQQFGPVARLRQWPVATLLQRWQAFAAHHRDAHAIRPLVDGDLFRAQPAQALLTGAGGDIDVLAGSNAQEFPVDAPNSQFIDHLDVDFGAPATAAHDYYFPNGAARPPDPLLGNAATQLVADVEFRCPSLLAAQAAPRAWVYQFEQPRPGATATGHSHELLYVWGNEGEWRLAQPLSPADLALIEQMQRYWTQFARTGDPNGPGLPDWPRYQREVSPYLAISAGRTAAQTHLRAETCSPYVEHWSDPAAYDTGPPR